MSFMPFLAGAARTLAPYALSAIKDFAPKILKGAGGFLSKIPIVGGLFNNLFGSKGPRTTGIEGHQIPQNYNPENFGQKFTKRFQQFSNWVPGARQFIGDTAEKYGVGQKSALVSGLNKAIDFTGKVGSQVQSGLDYYNGNSKNGNVYQQGGR